MADFRKMSAYVRWVDERENASFVEIVDDAKLIEKYQEESGLSRTEVSRIHNAAHKHDYLEKSIPFLQTSVNPKKGYSLIQKRWHIPTGVLRASFEENKTLIATTTAIIIAVCTVINLLIFGR